jgi:hyperosmotically inducible protein
MLKSKLLMLLMPAFLASSFAFGAGDNAGAYVSDSALTAKVKTELLLDTSIKSLPITVTTNAGVVTLTGIVNNELQKKKALKLVAHRKGVKNVKDELTVNASKQ